MAIRLVKSLASSASELLQPNSVGGGSRQSYGPSKKAKQF